jgi:DNA-binding phage protein
MYKFQANPKVRPYDTARYLTTEEIRTEYLGAVLEDGDMRSIQTALDNVVRSRNLARDTDYAGFLNEIQRTGIEING